MKVTQFIIHDVSCNSTNEADGWIRFCIFYNQNSPRSIPLYLVFAWFCMHVYVRSFELLQSSYTEKSQYCSWNLNTMSNTRLWHNIFGWHYLESKMGKTELIVDSDHFYLLVDSDGTICYICSQDLDAFYHSEVERIQNAKWVYSTISLAIKMTCLCAGCM